MLDLYEFLQNIVFFLKFVVKQVETIRETSQYCITSLFINKTKNELYKFIPMFSIKHNRPQRIPALAVDPIIDNNNIDWNIGTPAGHRAPAKQGSLE